MYADATEAAYLEYMIHEFYDGLLVLQNLEGLSDEELETLYALGYNLFISGKYEEAKNIFAGLSAYAPYTAHYWRALGAVNQQLQDYPEAISAYDMAVVNDETDIVSYVYRGESRILSGKIEESLRDLEAAVRIGAAYPEFAAWVQRANLLIGLHKLDGIQQ